MSGKVVQGILIGVAVAGAAFGGALLAGLGLKAAFIDAGLTTLAYAARFLPSGRTRQGIILSGVTDPQSPLPTVYGKCKVGMRYVDRRTGGTDNKDFYIVGALCHGSEDGNGIQGIDEIYFDDRLAVSADGVVQPAFIKDGVPLLFVTKNTGTDAQNYDGTLNSVFPQAWPTTSKGRGIAYIILHLVYDTEVYVTGEPTVTVIVRGCKVKDPANLGNAAAYSTNPARCLYDLLTSTRYGLGAAASRVDATSFASMATYYDTVVTKNSDTGSTGPLFTVNGAVDTGQSVKQNVDQLLTSCRGVLVYEGGKYRLLTRRVVSPTSFTLSEANIVGDWSINIPGVGDVPNVLHGLYVEPGPGAVITAISTLSPATITTQTDHHFIADQVVHIYMVGETVPGLTPNRLGTYTIASITSSTAFVLKDNIAFGSGYVSGSCAVTSEPLPYQVATRIWPRPGASNGYLTADNNYEVVHEISLPFTTDPYSAEQLILVALKEARAGTTVAVTATEAALALQVGDLVPVTHPTPGWVSKNFWVMGVFLIPGTMLVRLALLEYDSTAYTLDALNTIVTPPSTHLPNPFDCAPPADLVLISGDAQAQPDADGSHRPYILATWTASPETYLDFYEVEYRQSGTPNYRPAPDGNRVDTQAEIGPVSEGTSYDVRVRAINTLGISSDWAEDSIVPTLPTLQRTSSCWIDDFTSQTPGRRWVPVQGGIGTLVDVVDPDSLVGGKVGRLTGPGWYVHADSIPFDPNVLYTMRFRVRQLRDPGSGSKEFFLGVVGVAQTPGQPGVFTYVNTLGLDKVDTQHYILASAKSLPAGRAWTDYWGHFKGYAGGKVVLTAAMLSQSGLGSFSAANCVDGDTTPTNIGFSADAATAGASLKFDLGTPKAITECRFHMSAAGSTAQWQLQYSDNGTDYTDAG